MLLVTGATGNIGREFVDELGVRDAKFRVPATFPRPGGFMTNALDWLPTIREGGFAPPGSARTP